MSSVILEFKNEVDLERFAMTVSCGQMQLNVSSLTVVCDCAEAEIELAEKAFDARVIDRQHRTG